MSTQAESKVIVVVGSTQSRQRVRTLLCWIRALVPAAVLICSSVDALPRELDGAIVLQAEEVPSGPLSLADALARAMTASAR